MAEDQAPWHPKMFPKQLEIFNNYSRALLVSGPRISGKTHGLLHRIVRHLWETPNARVAMFTKVLKNSKDAGTWPKLHKVILPEWFKSGIGMHYTTESYDGVPGPKVDGQTRTPYFRVKNYYGGESEVMLFSLDNDGDTEAKLKEREFSMIYFSELSNFYDRKVLSVALLSLRMAHLSYDQHQWCADTNPSEEGESSWIYKVWWKERNQSYEEHKEENDEVGLPTMPEQLFVKFQLGLGLIEVAPEDNMFLDPRQLEELESTYAYDAGLYARYVKGKWVFGDGDASRHFRSFFKENLHVAGDATHVDETQWELINPSQNCFELITGWDLGDTNHAAAIIEKQMLNTWVAARKAFLPRGHFCILDEQVTIKQDISNEQFTEMFMELIAALEKDASKTFNLERAWSDRSSLEKYSATGDTFPYLQVADASGGRIVLQGVPKAAGSVRARVQLLKMLLAQGRFKVSAQCTATIRMLNDLKKGKGRLDFVVSDENKHIFDAITYALLMECAEELHNAQDNNVGTRSNGVTSIT